MYLFDYFCRKSEKNEHLMRKLETNTRFLSLRSNVFLWCTGDINKYFQHVPL